MAKTRRNAYDAAFKLKAIDLAVGKGNRAAARELGLNESMIRHWKQQLEELTQCKKTTKAFRGKKSRWPELENELEDWVNTQRADGRGVSTVQIRLKAKTIATAMKFEDFRGGPSWCLRFMRRKGLSIRVRTSLCQQLPPDYEEKVSNFRKFTDAKIAEHSIDPHDTINMDEVPLTHLQLIDICGLFMFKIIFFLKFSGCGLYSGAVEITVFHKYTHQGMLTGLSVSKCFNFYVRTPFSPSPSFPLSLCAPSSTRSSKNGDAVINRVLIGQ
uniref:HTH CENPB-type domain-containing protein n=1 Tax=Sander lucioperca TaxID=283035 RepID=A0A8C9YEP1_SANLU